MKLVLTIMVFFSGLFLVAQEKMVGVKVNNEISLKIPESFNSMTDGERVNKFVSSKTPLGMYTSEDRTIDLGININIMPWIPGDEEKLRSFYKGTYETLFTEIEYLQDTIREINGKKFIVFEFLSTIVEDNAISGSKTSSYYSYIQYTSYKGQILLFNFGCKPRKMSEWQLKAREIMESVTIKE